MSKLSRYLLTLMVVSILLGTGAVALGLSIHLNGYAAKQARTALMWPEEQQKENGEQPVLERMELMADYRGRLLNVQGNISREDALVLLNYYMDNRAQMLPGVTHRVSVDGSDYYIARLPIFSPRGHIRLGYVNPVSLSGLLGRLNVIFASVLAGTLLLAVAVGVMAGRRVESAQGRMKAFFENASHDLRTPLTVIQGYADAVQAGVVSPEEGGAAIITQGERMSHLVEEILMLSRIDAGERELNLETVDLRDLLVEATSQLRHAAQAQQKRIVMQLPEVKVMRRVDVGAMLRAIQNILDNAVRYARTTITVRLWTDRLHTHITIADDGAGIPESELHQVFERYYRGSGGHNGIGLSLAQELVMLHGGRVTASNDGGACFDITLPRRLRLMPRKTKP